MQPTGDRTDNSLLPNDSIDKTIGWIVLVMGIFLVLAIAVSVLSEVQQVASRPGHVRAPAPAAPEAEMGGMAR
jgi:hypothetical protein